MFRLFSKYFSSQPLRPLPNQEEEVEEPDWDREVAEFEEQQRLEEEERQARFEKAKAEFDETPDASISVEEWRDRYIHVAGKLGMVLGLNNQERQWVRDAGRYCPMEEDG